MKNFLNLFTKNLKGNNLSKIHQLQIIDFHPNNVLIVENAKKNNYELECIKKLFSVNHKENIFHQKEKLGNDVVIYSNERVYFQNINYFFTYSQFDFIIFDIEAESLTHPIEVVVYEILYPLMSENGLLFIRQNIKDKNGSLFISNSKLFIKNLIKRVLKNQNILKRDFYQEFCKDHSKCDFFEIIQDDENNFKHRKNVLSKNLLLKKKNKKSLFGTRAVYPKQSNRDFSIWDLKKFFLTLYKKGCVSCTATEFYNFIKDGYRKGYYLVKHDIHRDLRRTINIAEIEADIGIKTVFFAVPQHDLTKAYFDSLYMWNAFKRIKNMGHEIALHFDFHDLIITHGSLASGIKNTLNIFAEHGFKVETANLHGNTENRKLYGSPKAFLKKLATDSESLKHIYPICHKDFEKYYASISLEYIANEYGILNWIDNEFYRLGRKINTDANISDNSGTIKLKKNGDKAILSLPFEIDKEFRENASKILLDNNSLMLFHPQYFEIF